MSDKALPRRLLRLARAPRRVGPREALATVRQEVPEFDVTGASLVDDRGAWEVMDRDHDLMDRRPRRERVSG